jgi:hypothetical protein
MLKKIIVIFVILLLSACSTIKVPSKQEIKYINKTAYKIIKDSIYLRDTVSVQKQGDTIFWKEKIYKDRFHYDTISTKDTINNNIIQTKIQKQIIKKVDWKKTIIFSCILSALILALVIALKITKR